MAIAIACALLGGCATPSEPQPPVPTASRPAPSETVSRNQAIEAALGAAGGVADEEWQVRSATAGTLGQVLPEREHYEWATDLQSDLPVWGVSLMSGDRSALVVLDFTDASVYGVVLGIAN